VDAALEQLLAEVGASVHVPAQSLWPRVHAALEPLADVGQRRQRVRPLVLAAAIAVLVAIALVSIAPARRAVADFFGIGSTTIVRVDRTPNHEPPARREDLPASTDVRALRVMLRRAGLHLPTTKLVGTPVAWHVDPDGETVVAFADVVFTERREGGVPAVKRVPPGRAVTSTTVDGAPALWIEGSHTRIVQGREWQSDSALIWTAGGMELRLEGDVDLSTMRRVASSVGPVRV
jgi:hypothetical protein